MKPIASYIKYTYVSARLGMDQPFHHQINISKVLSYFTH